MRALKIMLFLAALVSFVSCSKEENDPELETEMLLGEWHLEEFNYSGTNVYSAGNETASVSYTGEAVEIDFETVFLKDGTYITVGTYTIILTSTAEGETTVEEFTYSDINTTGTYNIDGNKITTTHEQEYPGQETIAEISEGVIKELTPNRLILTYEYSGTTEVWGMEVEVNTNVIQIFSR
ncbi:lipocalin family protein [Salinimicrobium sp. TH3]|uniref:lipocalin family protein n=1 Tax=Salinimicrobium sp. TH3 TaxID=2997342 RepID=UPI002274456C|nr:lipocalin family protein [Salinimicrobium sp. TH3]MCY2686022.1 lipocalin family protein [Salinimicrobium sp. TH3]